MGQDFDRGGRPASAFPISIWQPLASALAILLTLLAVGEPGRSACHACWASPSNPQQYLAAILAVTLPLAFLMLPANRGSENG